MAIPRTRGHWLLIQAYLLLGLLMYLPLGSLVGAEFFPPVEDDESDCFLCGMGTRKNEVLPGATQCTDCEVRTSMMLIQFLMLLILVFDYGKQIRRGTFMMSLAMKTRTAKSAKQGICSLIQG